MSRIKAPIVGYGDIGIAEHPDSPMSISNWINQITNAVNGLANHTGYVPNLRIKPKLPLTSKQEEVYEFIKLFSLEHHGLESPTLKTICDHFGYKGVSSAQRHVEALILKGVIERQGHRLVVKEIANVSTMES